MERTLKIKLFVTFEKKNMKKLREKWIQKIVEKLWI
jgi:hypothetical protein